MKRIAGYTVIVVALLALVGCGQPLVGFSTEDTSGGEDAATDTGVDTTTDAVDDVSEDVAEDTGGDSIVDDTGTEKDGGEDVDVDTEPPFVVSTVPRDGENAVPVYETVRVRFSEEINADTLDSTTFTLNEVGGDAVTGTVTASGDGGTFEPDADLEAGTEYRATIEADVEDPAGNRLGSSYAWTFRTADPTAPTVVATNPAHLAVDVSLDTEISAVFSEPMNPSTLDGSVVTVTQGGSPIAGSVTATTNSVTFTPDNSLASDTDYTVTIGTGAESQGGVSLAQEYSWSFTTVPDPGIPTVTSTRPFDLETDVSPNRRIRVDFSEVMDPSTIDMSSFTLTQGGSPVSGKIKMRKSDTRAVFIPDGELTPNRTYRAVVESSVEDLDGNTLPGTYEWAFATGETIRPTIVATEPDADATDVPVGSTVEVVFSKKMDASTIDATTFQVEQGGSPVGGQISTTSAKVAVFTPNSDLVPNTTYTVTVTPGVKDRAGNGLIGQVSWTFTTGTP